METKKMTNNCKRSKHILQHGGNKNMNIIYHGVIIGLLDYWIIHIPPAFLSVCLKIRVFRASLIQYRFIVLANGNI